MLRSTALVVAILCVAAPASAQSIQLTGPDGSQRLVAAAALATLPHEMVTITDHTKQATFSGASLRALASLAGAPEGEALRGPALSMVVVVTAADGYRVALSLAEIDPGIGGRKAILADSAAQTPLDAHQGPFRLVVDGDKRPVRSARNVVSVAVKTVN